MGLGQILVSMGPYLIEGRTNISFSILYNEMFSTNTSGLLDLRKDWEIKKPDLELDTGMLRKTKSIKTLVRENIISSY